MKLDFNADIEALRYGYNTFHALICDSIECGMDIGEHGENLTIMVLSMNRSEATIEMLESVRQCMPEFAGKILIVDNGSQENEKEAVKNYFSQMHCQCNMLELEKNYGVAGGRNRGVKEITTEWFMSLDNDIYFVGDPIAKIRETIFSLGCHFLNLPLFNDRGNQLFSNGGHLYLYPLEDGVHVGGGSLFIQEKCKQGSEYAFSLGTFLFGGASVVRKETFLSCGGFDEGMFIGFEDIDFSLTLYRRGYKIGNLGMACLIHNHVKPKTDADRDYEQERYSRKILKESADYFEKKNNMVVWNTHVDAWLKERQEQLGLKSSETVNKPKIALLIDARNWAFDNIAHQLERYLSDRYEFYRIYMNEMDNIAQVLFFTKECDLVHFFWRPHLNLVDSDYCRQYIEALGGNFASFYRDYVAGKNFSTCVYDHLLLGEEDRAMIDGAFSHAAHYYVSSGKLLEEYQQNARFKDPDDVLPDGVDLTLFKPQNLDRLKEIDKRPLRIGWVGNSKWQTGDLKGIETIIKPAIQELCKKGYAVELITSDRQNKLIPHREMPRFYADIDLYVCASTCEGTPNPVLEAMACGVPVISTDVGIVRDVFGMMQKDYILEERSIECLVEKVEKILKDPQILLDLSQENLKSIRNWDWSIMAENFAAYFDYCLR